MSDQFNFRGRGFNPENTSLAHRGGDHSHYFSNPGSGSWSTVNDASCYHPYTFLTGTYSVYTPRVPRHQFAEYDRGTDGVVDTSRVVGRFPLKRKHPDGSAAFDMSNSSWSPVEANFSMSGLLDRQFDDNQYMSENTTSLQRYSRSYDPITLNDSGRNVRSRSGPNLAPTPHRNHLSFTSQHFQTTDVPVNHSLTYPQTDAHTSAAWNFNSESSHGPWRTPVSETNRVSSDANHFQTERHGGEADQYNYGAIAGRWHTNFQNDRARGAIERYATMDRNDGAPLTGFHAGYGYASTSLDYCLQFPTEAYSSRYSRSSLGTGHTSYHGPRRNPVSGRWHVNYQRDRARGAIEHYTSHAPMERNVGAPLERNVGAPLNGFHTGYGNEATSSDYYLQFPTEAYSPRYSRSFTGTGHTSYQSDMAWNTNGHFPSLAAAMNRSDSMEPQPHAFEDDAISYSPSGPRDRDADDQYEAMRLDIDNMSYEDLLVLGEHIGNVKTGLSEDKVLNCLVESLECASEHNKEEKHCPICLDEFSNMDKAMKLRSCGHEYHLHCISKWLDKKTVCPMCKRPVASDS